MSLEFARNELDYWQQLIENNAKLTANLSALNDQVGELIGLSTQLIARDEHEYSAFVLSVIRNMQEVIKAALTTLETQAPLVSGRLKMIRKDLDLPED